MTTYILMTNMLNHSKNKFLKTQEDDNS